MWLYKDHISVNLKKGVLMAKLLWGTLSAVVLITTGSAFAANYAPQYGQRYAPQYAPQYGQGYAPRAAAPQPAQTQNDPARKVSQQLSKLRAFLEKTQGGTVDPAQALQYIERQISPDVDFATMTRMSLGRLANRMTAQQRSTAQSILRNNFTSKLVQAMGDIRATHVSVGQTRPGTSRGELVVPVQLDRWRGQPMLINFRFFKSSDGWKVFDAEANGQSAVLFYRGYFARQWRGG